MILDIHGQAGDIDYLEASDCNFHSITPWPNARKCVESRRVGARAGCGITVNVNQLYLGTGDAQSGWVHDLSRDSRGFELRQSRRYKAGSQQEREKEAIDSHNPTGETEHRFVFLYRRMPESGDLFFNKNLWQRYQTKRRVGRSAG